MSSIEELWERLEESGPSGAIRVDDARPADLYGATDAAGRVGLLLVTDLEPPAAPSFDAVDVTTTRRHDARWALGIWLADLELRPVFAELCTDLIETSATVAAQAAPGFLLTRLVRWKQLLERGATPMGMSQLRGLMGELTVLRECLAVWRAADVVSGWLGPAGAPQDFVLPNVRVEVKTVFPSARTVQISSIDQLDNDGPLRLAVVTITTLISGADGFAPSDLVSEVREAVRSAGGEAVLAELDHRIATTRYRVGDPRYDRPMFRFEGLRYFAVEGRFPRVRRADLLPGVERAAYEIALGALGSHASGLAG
jgi:Putative  PD-(D/E)XK family member, (DUF4420)